METTIATIKTTETISLKDIENLIKKAKEVFKNGEVERCSLISFKIEEDENLSLIGKVFIERNTIYAEIHAQNWGGYAGAVGQQYIEPRRIAYFSSAEEIMAFLGSKCYDVY